MADAVPVTNALIERNASAMFDASLMYSDGLLKNGISIEKYVHLSPDINYMEYPNPADAMRETALDLTAKIEANQSRYVDKARYHDGSKYSSCSAKTISQVREWYVDEVLHQVNEQYGGASNKIDDEINSSFDESADDVREANKNGASLLKSALCFPIGLTMRAEHVMDDGTKYDVDDLAYWEENVDSILKYQKCILFIGLIFITAGIGEYIFRDLPFEKNPEGIVKGAIKSIKSMQKQEQMETI